MAKKNGSKKKIDGAKIFVRVMSALLAGLMLLAGCGTLLYYVLN